MAAENLAGMYHEQGRDTYLESTHTPYLRRIIQGQHGPSNLNSDFVAVDCEHPQTFVSNPTQRQVLADCWLENDKDEANRPVRKVFNDGKAMNGDKSQVPYSPREVRPEMEASHRTGASGSRIPHVVPLIARGDVVCSC
jgi:hypothetical protein